MEWMHNGKPVIEFGNSTTISLRMDQATTDEVSKMVLGQQSRELVNALNWIRDAEWIEYPHIVESPNRTDIMGRFRSIGWYGRFASQGYVELRNHFACKQKHIPSRITADFITDMVEEYAAQSYYDKLDEDD